MADARGPAVGAEAPEFTAPLSTSEGTTRSVSLSSLCEDRAVLLVFQPTDFGLEPFAEESAVGEYGWFTVDDRVRVVGVNRARPRTNRKFAAHLDVPYPFCSDRNLSIARAYGVTYRAFGVAPRARPACFFVDSDGVVRHRWVADRARRSHARAQIRDLYESVLEVLGRPTTETFGLA
ncbi:redoxin domain-containing protein [Halorussus marinus]|uniref:redoxin domain-containing protein n=1 Tax=Halorussus marinus TaxID=2505976 RepID=UPI00143CFD09|nr:redoxin domain-containing protein [Halorussus marinus]